jgi:hypothetical protein
MVINLRFGVKIANKMPKQTWSKKMSKISLQNGGGPGSSISLAPETIKVRNALIEKFTDEPLDEMNHFMSTALANEQNEMRRIGILAARIFLLRTRIANLQDFNRDASLTEISEINLGAFNLGSADINAIDDDVTDDIEDGWARLKMTSSGEVQGVRFLSGAIIDAKPEDAEKLIQSGKAVRIDENGNITERHQESFDNDDEAGSASEARYSVENENDSIDPNDNESAEPDKNMSSDMTGEQTVEVTNDAQPEMVALNEATSEDLVNAKAEQPTAPDDELSNKSDESS